MPTTVLTYTISVYRVQDRLRNCWTAEWDVNSRYSSDGPDPGIALRNLLRLLANTNTPAHPEAPVLPLQDQPINQELLEALIACRNLLSQVGLQNQDADLEQACHEEIVTLNALIAKAEGR